MKYCDGNSNEDDFLKNLYSEIKIEKILELYVEEEEVDENVCSICGHRGSLRGNIFRDSNDNMLYVKPDILYQMKFPLNVVIPIGLTNKDILCRECKDWIDFIYKMQSRVGLLQDEIPDYEIERKERKGKHEEEVKEIIIRNEMRERQSEIIHELRKEIRKLNGSKTSTNKEKLKKELIEISDKISISKYGYDHETF